MVVMGMEYSFSIREYAARMRSVDVVKCWPFEETDEDTVKAMLPPITIKKFRWWFDELELIHSNSGGYGKISNKKGEISDLDSENIESMRIKKANKGGKGKLKLKLKNKPPKKRSIVELFAVSPQVERVNSDNGDEDDDDNDDDDSSYNEEDSDAGRGLEVLPVENVSSKCKNKRKVKKKDTASMLGKKMKVLKNMKKRVCKKTKRKETALASRNATKLIDGGCLALACFFSVVIFMFYRLSYSLRGIGLTS